MKWHRPEYDEKVKELKEGDTVYLRTDIKGHEDDIGCGFVPEHIEYQGKEVCIHNIPQTSIRKYRIFKISASAGDVWFDTDMIDWEKTEQSKNGVNKLIDWIK